RRTAILLSCRCNGRARHAPSDTRSGSACVRRFLVRRGFETFVPAGTRQPHWQSVVESGVDTALGFAIAVVLQMLIYGEMATLLRASGLTFLVYGFAMLRRYLLRRLFAAWSIRPA